jgi:nucleoside-diphosphate-sugar epimerase
MPCKISVMGCGWLGLPLAAHLKNNGFEVSGTYRNLSKISELAVHGINPFFLSIDIDKLLVGLDMESLWNAEVFVITIPPKTEAKDFLRGMEQILDKILLSGKNKRIIYISSTGVYGKTIGLINESAACKPDRATAKTILACEELIQKKIASSDFTILRMAGLVGKNRKAGNFFAGKENLTNADSPVNLVHLDDCIKIISKLIENDIREPILNVCADKHPLHKDYYTKEAEKLGVSAPKYLIDSSNDDKKEIDNSLLKKVLCYKFLHPDPSEFPL